MRPLAAAAALAAVLVAAPAASADPSGAVGGVRDPAAGTLALTVLAVEDDGVGLRQATAILAGRPLDSAYFGDPACLADASDPDRGCPAAGSVTLEVPTTAVADGAHRLEVIVEDGAGGAAHLVDRAIEVLNTPPQWTSTVTLTLGSGAQSDPPSGPSGDTPRPPAAAGCRSPRLSMVLAERPLRRRRGTPVLEAGRRYRFRGRLTCRTAGGRRAAPRGTRVDVRAIAGRRTVRKPDTRVGADGRISVRVSATRSGTLVFAVRAQGGGTIRVRVPVRVARAGRGRA